MKNTFLEPFTNKLPHVCLILEMLINKKWFTVKLRKKPTVFGNEVLLYFSKKIENRVCVKIHYFSELEKEKKIFIFPW
jgi:hypothetical protein